jgi:uncharacterized protein with FMN-binding domain
MNRALLTTAAAAAGVTGVLVLAPHVSPVTASASTGTTTGSPGSSDGSAGTVTGNVAQHRFGPIQVEITVSQGTITDIQVVQEPSDGKSRWINSQAVPILISQALAAQSGSIDGVSGATLTSQAFVTSLTSAMSKAGL